MDKDTHARPEGACVVGTGADLGQRRRDAAVGRALREAAKVAPSQPRIHVSWATDRGGTSGMWLSDEPLYFERCQFAETARDLYEAAAEYAEGLS